jgi:hypothetical protein
VFDFFFFRNLFLHPKYYTLSKISEKSKEFKNLKE